MMLTASAPILTVRAQQVKYGVTLGDSFTYGTPDGGPWVSMCPSNAPPLTQWDQFVNCSTLTFCVLNDSQKNSAYPGYTFNQTLTYRNGSAPLSIISQVDLYYGYGAGATFFISPGLENDSYIYPGAAASGNYTWQINSTRNDMQQWPGVTVCVLNYTRYTPVENSSSPMIATRTTFFWDQSNGVLLGAFEESGGYYPATGASFEGVLLYELIGNNIGIPMDYATQITINRNGSISPSTANITTSDNVTYTFTDNNYLPIVVNRSNIIINGMGYTLQALGGYAFYLSAVNNVTIKDTTITNSSVGIHLESSSNCTVAGNNITNNYDGIELLYGTRNILSRNNVTATSEDGIDLYHTSGNILSGNRVTASGVGYGFGLSSSSGNILSGNNATANKCGLYIRLSSSNVLYSNDFINNTQQVSSDGSPNTWEDGYPSGGNYWSDYQTRYPSAVENDSSAIWKTPYVIDVNNTDRYPLMAPFKSFYIMWNDQTHPIDTVSNSTLSNFSFNATAKTLTFNATGPGGTTGFCRVAIPQDFMWCDSPGEWLVLITEGSGSQLHYLLITPNVMNDSNYTYLCFNYTHSTHTVLINSTHSVPEFQPYMLLPLFMIIALLGTMILKRKRRLCYLSA